MKKLFEFGEFIAVANVICGTKYNWTTKKEKLVVVSYFTEWCGQFREIEKDTELTKEATLNLSEQVKAWCLKKGYRLYSY